MIVAALAKSVVTAQTPIGTTMKQLLADIRACRECELHLPHGPRPVIQAHPSARLLIIGQAPGARVHDSGISGILGKCL